MCDRTVRFSVLCSMLEAISRNKKPALKRKYLRTFLDHVYTDHEFFSALRLILPVLDKERGTYGLKEAALARCLADALGLAKESEDAKRLLHWKAGGPNAGNFPLVAAEVLFRRQITVSGGLLIKDVNDYLDRLASAEGREDKTAILAELIHKTNAQEMKWIILIILKELKLGMSEKTVLHEFHPDAEDLFNVTCDLKLVCEKLKDRSQRFQRQDIEVGKPVRPQLASRVADVEEAWRKLRGKRIIAECKFDGDRIQIHKNGNDVHFFSRSFIDHKEYIDGLAPVILKQVRIEKCILDGEMLVWNKLTNRFAEFGSNQEVAKAAREGLNTDQQLCYVAFDILYSNDSSVTHRSLCERQMLLKEVVQPLRGSLELLLPGTGAGSDDTSCWSMPVHSPQEINKFFLQTVENRDEGIVLKDLDSKWEPGDRSSKWIKLKPDYVHAESDLDALIIGCYLGAGRRGGEIGQFLLGVAEQPNQGGNPTRFLSFCKVGSGLSENERDVLVSKLKPYLSKKPPSFYTVTNHAKERPDFWVTQPEKSVILEITSDIRTIKSEVFAAPYSLRFPRTRRVRYDKPWYDCLTVKSLVEIVHSRDGNTVDMKENNKSFKARVPKARKTTRLVPLVPSHMLVTDVSNVKHETSIFKHMVFHFINVQAQSLRDSLHKMVAENGGSFSMNLNSSVTHAIAAEKKGIRYQAAALHADIIHQSWVTDCCAQKSLLPLTPKYILHLTKDSKLAKLGDMDEFGDSYFQDNDISDLKQLFENLDGLELHVDKEELCNFEKKFCLKAGFGLFCGCQIYFHNPIHSKNLDTQAVAEIVLKRLELEVLMSDGEVTDKLKDATHMVIYSSADHPVSLHSIMRSISNEDRNLLILKKLHAIKHTWLETALTSNKKPEEDSFSFIDTKDASEEGVSTPSKVLMEQVPPPAARLSKRGRPMIREDDLPSEGEELIPKRQLFSDASSKSQRMQSHDGIKGGNVTQSKSSVSKFGKNVVSTDQALCVSGSEAEGALSLGTERLPKRAHTTWAVNRRKPSNSKNLGLKTEKQDRSSREALGASHNKESREQISRAMKTAQDGKRKRKPPGKNNLDEVDRLGENSSEKSNEQSHRSKKSKTGFSSEETRSSNENYAENEQTNVPASGLHFVFPEPAEEAAGDLSQSRPQQAITTYPSNDPSSTSGSMERDPVGKKKKVSYKDLVQKLLDPE